mmetsp:Transcript_1761/g.3490  ORF Transcript_1761/g.3490 Transcript_1761/m.3490 type:complete len:80 (+) Transcript_1761:96-335(+)
MTCKQSHTASSNGGCAARTPTSRTKFLQLLLRYYQSENTLALYLAFFYSILLRGSKHPAGPVGFMPPPNPIHVTAVQSL